MSRDDEGPASSLAGFSIVATSSALSRVVVSRRPAPATCCGRTRACQSSAARRSRYLPTLAEGLATSFDCAELLVQPLIGVGEAGFPALEVPAPAHALRLDRAVSPLRTSRRPLGGLLGFPGGLRSGFQVASVWRGAVRDSASELALSRWGCGRRPGERGFWWHSGAGASDPRRE